MIIINILYFISGFMIFWAMIGYPVFLKILGKLSKKENKVDLNYHPTVTLMIVAHNEEKVIENKLMNAISLDYDPEKYKILVTSDNSTDKTNLIVKNFILSHPKSNLQLYEVKNRLGKTNAQNEAQKIIESEIIVMTDANAILEKDSIKKLVSSFSDQNIAYVSGILKYTNEENNTAESESNYWDSDISMRLIESRIQCITAGNGALYACRNSDYVDFPPIECHDSSMPFYYATHGKRAICNKNAIAFEKAGEVDSDEFKRKVRMNRIILKSIFNTFKILNIFKYKWFTIFYFGHRTSRYLLWLNHILFFIMNAFNFKLNMFFYITFIIQVVIYIILLSSVIFNIDNKIFRLIKYYFMTVYAQIVGIYNILFGKIGATWEKAESTR